MQSRATGQRPKAMGSGECLPASVEDSPLKPGVGPMGVGYGAHESIKYTYVGTAAYVVRDFGKSYEQSCPTPDNLSEV